MITNTKAGQTNHCPNCEDQARRIEELERRERMLVDALRVSDDCLSLELYPSEGNVRQEISAAINATPSHSAAWEWNRHVEWAKQQRKVAEVRGPNAMRPYPHLERLVDFSDIYFGTYLIAIPELKEVKK